MAMAVRTLKEKQGRLCSSASCKACSVTPTAKEVPTKTIALGGVGWEGGRGGRAKVHCVAASIMAHLCISHRSRIEADRQALSTSIYMVRKIRYNIYIYCLGVGQPSARLAVLVVAVRLVLLVKQQGLHGK